MPIRSHSRTPWRLGARSSKPAAWVRILGFGLALGCFGPPALGAAASFANPDRIRYDGQCLTIDDRDVFVFSTSFRYFRCPRALWRDRFRRIREAGCNAVETVVPWSLRERAAPAGPDDFSKIDHGGLRDWLRMAHDEFGLYTIVRPGPYVGERDGGGFPPWMPGKRPPDAGSDWLRGELPEFLKWERDWMRAVGPVIAAQQVTRRAPGRGGVILVQIEGEYDRFPNIPERERVPALKALYEDARAAGIDVPIFSCWTKECRDSADPVLSQVFDTITVDHPWKIDETASDLVALEAAQPDAPPMITELRSGAPATVGGAPGGDQGGLVAAQYNANALLAIQDGATVINTPLMFGGADFGRWAARGVPTSTAAAPIGEPDGAAPAFAAAAAIGRMLRHYGPELVRSRPLLIEVEAGSPDVSVAARVAHSGTLYLFVRNHSARQGRRGTAAVWLQGAGELGVNYDLPPLGFRILRLTAQQQISGVGGQWLPETAPRARRPTRAHTPAPTGSPMGVRATESAPRAGKAEAR
ncbi:MAG: beta-galactosidase [Opitutaceae bacterium]